MISSQSSSGSAPSPHTAARPSAVVGLRRPTSASSSPLRALKSIDLPAPVGPASATTVDSTPRPRRAPALSIDATAVRDRVGVEAAVGEAHRLRERGEAVVEVELHEARLTASIAVWRLAIASASGCLALEERREAVALVAQEIVDALHEVVARPRRERAHRLIAEQGLEQLVSDGGRAAGDDRLEPGQPPGAREDREHHREPRAVHAERGEPRRRALRRALAADEIHDVPLPRSHLVARLGAKLVGRARQRGCRVDERSSGRVRRSRRRRRARLRARPPLARPPRADARRPREARRRRPRGRSRGSRAGRGSPRGETGARASGRPCRRPRASAPRPRPAAATRSGVRPRPPAGQTRTRDRPPSGGPPRRRAARRRRARPCPRGREGSAGRRSASCGSGRTRACASAASPSSQRRTGARSPGARRPASSSVSATTSSTASIPCARIISPRCAVTSRSASLGHAVEHERERRPTLARRPEELPRHGVRVARRRRHEEPGVRGGKELGRESAVLREHGVDVGGIQQSQAGRKLRSRLQQQRPGCRRAARDPAGGRAGSCRPSNQCMSSG